MDGPDQETSPYLKQRESGDLIGDALRDSRANGLRFVARFDFSRLPSRFVDAHPEWAYRTADGDVCTADGLTNICPRSDYYEIRAAEILTDFVDRYDVDGLFFNWLQFPEASYRMDYYGPCHCTRCLDAFAREHPSADYPTGPDRDSYGSLVALNRRHLQRLADRFAALLKARRPEAALFLADARVDMVFLETNSPLGGAAHWWAHTPSELASANVIAHPEVPAMVHSAVNVGLPYRLIGEQPAQYTRYVGQALARGARPSAVVIGPPTTEHFAALPAAVPLLQLYQREHAMYGALEPAARVAVVRPRGGSALAALQDRSDFEEYRGLFESLQQAHVPFDVLGAEFMGELVARDVLSRYRVIAMPGGVATDDLSVSVRRYAEQGGAVVLTGDPAAAGTLPAGIRVERTLDGVRELGGRFGVRPDGAFGDRLPVLGTFWAVAGATGDGWFLSDQAPFGPPELTYGNETLTAHPLRFRHRIGEGTIAYLPWTAGVTKRRSGLSSVAGLVTDTVLDLLGDERTVRATISSSVEIVLGRAGGSLVIHLLNHSGGVPERLIDPQPAAGIVHVPGRLLSAQPVATSLTRRARLETALDGPDLAIEVAVTDVEVVRLD
ncbi:hypothetical protein C1I92_11135 [Jiangella anatolica]|uniref:Beta-galactosidase trimerisation domain-containing protein n=1 Tax=Jiangella anatolica TaxID=2670374 RepID=A0A2W2C6P6_9ACTN|nr:hypothetical protein C1I92_11135 [Jiangella anatolica]